MLNLSFRARKPSALVSMLAGDHDDTDIEGMVRPFEQRDRSRWTLFFITISLTFILLISALAIGLSARHSQADMESTSTANATMPKRNVILMISDGYGPASETLTRSYFAAKRNLTDFTNANDDLLPLDKIFAGSVRTRSSSSQVTDSAAAATAFSTGFKTYNGAIGVDPITKKPLGTILEAAKAQGYLTGLVATSRITHATPASFSSHVVERNMENDIAVQQIFGSQGLSGRQVDILMGGGLCQFVPSIDDRKCRGDGRNLVSEAQNSSWTFLNTRQDFDMLNSTQQLPILALFTPDHMSYEIDRNPIHEPSLAEMALKSLQILDSKILNSTQGFFLMIEGSRIDMAGHANDPESHITDTLAYQETVQMVQKYIDTHPDTLLISVSDHETGGTSVGMQLKGYPEYKWRPEQLFDVKVSTEMASKILFDNYFSLWQTGGTNISVTVESDVFGKIVLNILAVSPLSDSNPNGYNPADQAYIIESIRSSYNEILAGVDPATKAQPGYNPSTGSAIKLPVQYRLSAMESRNAEVGWTTHGHTGVDVNLYMYGGISGARSSSVAPSRFGAVKNGRPMTYLPSLLPKTYFNNTITWTSSSNSDIADPSAMFPFVGTIDNTDIAGIISNYLSLDLNSITKKLQS